ncbi:MAG: EF-hand domain-containing protein [Pseudomonadota bacterium]
MTPTRALLALGCATLLASPLAANPLTRADANGDGAISRAEAQDARQPLFTRFDRNGDGVISDTEAEAILARLAAAARIADGAMVLNRQQLDTDGDGAISEAEFMARNPMFERIDRDGDGLASAEEIAAARDAFAARR